MKFLFWLCCLIVAYVYLGYPMCLTVLTRFKKKGVIKKESVPKVSLLVAAYNEEKVIREKIVNALSLDYPKDKLEIIIASDGSTDKTNDIITEYHKKGMILGQLKPRRGKISTLNEIIPKTKGEIIVLSDANTMFRPDAIKMFVRNFYDKSVGAVSGDVRLFNENISFGKSENLYYKLERFIQAKESDLHSIIGVDGGMYAIRKKLYNFPPDNTILDDDVIPMGVINRGYRVIYEPEAIAAESSCPNLKEEFRRRTRVAAGYFQSFFHKDGMPSISRPTIVFEYISHRLLRWLSPFFLVLLFFSNLFLLGLSFYKATLILQVYLYLSALIGSKIDIKIFSFPFHFCMANLAILVGFCKAITGNQKVAWEPVRR